MTIKTTKNKRKTPRKSSNSKTKEIKNQLKTLEKNQIIDIFMELLNKHESLTNETLELIPKPDLSAMFKKHEKLIKAIERAKPNSRFGSTSDNYSYKRCKSAISHARTAMISVQTKQNTYAHIFIAKKKIKK